MAGVWVGGWIRVAARRQDRSCSWHIRFAGSGPGIRTSGQGRDVNAGVVASLFQLPDALVQCSDITAQRMLL